MFIRETVTKSRKTNKEYIKHVLVESYRTEKGPRQRVVMQLGKLDLPKSQWKKLAAALESRLAGQSTLLKEESIIAEAADLVMEQYIFAQNFAQEKEERRSKANLVSIDLNSVATAQSRSLGPELVAHSMWQQLGFNQLLINAGFTPTQQALAEAVILGRLIAPDSDLATWRWLRERTALIELLPADLTRIRKDAIYEIADDLLAQKAELEKELRLREVDLFSLNTSVYLYDLTNTYFEGSALNNELAKRGKSKEKRTDCPLVTLALVVDDCGFPLFSQIYGGNQPEPETLGDILERLEKEAPINLFTQKSMIVMDRGIATGDNLKLIKSMGFSYVVIERRAAEKEYIEEFQKAKETFEKIEASMEIGERKKEVYVKKLPQNKGSRVLCLSEGRAEKEDAIYASKDERFIEDLKKLQKSIEKGNIKAAEKVNVRLGRLKERHSKVSRFFDINLKLDKKNENVLELTFEKKKAAKARSTLTGCYVIETSETELSAQEVWRIYTTLTKIEASFRALKTDLGVRPVYHQLTERTKGHLFISVLAYHLLISIEYQLRAQGDHRSWSTINNQLSTHQRTTVILTDEKEQIHHIRTSGMPERAHKEIYKLLGVKDPLKRHHEIVGNRL